MGSFAYQAVTETYTAHLAEPGSEIAECTCIENGQYGLAQGRIIPNAGDTQIALRRIE